MSLHARLSRRFLLAAASAASAMLLVIIGFIASRAASAAPVGLGTASTFAVLAGSTITNTGPTTISGSVGVNPGTEVTGAPTVLNGTVYSSNDRAVSLQAKDDARTAYVEAAGRPSSGAAGADLGGQVLTAGVYSGDTLQLTGALVLDGQNNPDAVFVFQSAATLITAPNSVVTLVNGATACNVFWQVATSATLDTNTVFVGTLLASASITAAFGTDVEGRLLADTGQVTLDTATIVLPRCGPGATATVTATGPATTETITASGPTTTVAGPATTETVTAGPTTTVTAQAVPATVTVTAPGATTTVAGAGGTVTITAEGAGNGGAPSISQATETVTATVVLSVQADGQTVAVQTVAPTGATRGAAGGSTPGGLAFTGSSDMAFAVTGLALVCLGGFLLLLTARTPARHRKH